MSREPLILTYHAVGPGSGPLETAPDLLAEQVDALLERGATFVTVGELAVALREGKPSGSEVALTFDDGFRSVVEHAAPLLAEHDLPATIYCVAGHLGGVSDWPSRRPGSDTMPLADVAELRELATAGFEIGCHGHRHAPILSSDAAFLQTELVDSRDALEQAVGVRVRTFALPYGAGPSETARRVLERTYDAVCTTRVARVTASADPYALPRVDASYVRSTATLLRLAEGKGGAYLQARGVAARVRRAFVADYSTRMAAAA